MQDKDKRHNEDSGLQFVLDNRRLIVGFALLIVLCGGFFILGFVEGKRQAGPQDVAIAPSEMTAGQRAALRPPGGGERETNPAGSPDSERSVAQPPASSVPAEPPKAEPEAEPRASSGTSRPETVVQSKPTTSAGIEYTVQVGAFRQRKEVDIKAGMLRAKGYDCTIEPPQAPDQLFLLQVGRYKTRAEAVRMQLKLRNDGFASFIKSR